ncbi:hypothetical protein XH88_35790 [Bradyrhizobium sp. CCBAU 51627]|nr:hypothetical protein [Bradyrhizobium sp. CCBAU 51627]
MQASYFAIPASPQDDEPDHIAKEAAACLPDPSKFIVVQDTAALFVLTRSGITFKRTALDVAVGRFRAPSEHRPQSAERVQLFARDLGELSEFTLNRRIVKVSKRASKIQAVKETKRLRLRTLGFAFVVFLFGFRSMSPSIPR